MTSRRQFLRTCGQGSVYGLPLMIGLSGSGRAAMACDSVSTAEHQEPLKEQAGNRGLLFGSAADRNVLEADPFYGKVLAAECSMVTPENSMKWERLRPSPEGFDFENADWLMTFADRHGLAVHGHTLVWHLQNPPWLEDHLSKDNAEAVLVDHIREVAGRYAGRVRAWDVVNEAIDPEAGRGDGLAPSPWLDHLGPDYIELAYRAAAEADPKAMLVYNDYGIEYEGAWYQDRRDHILDMLTGLVMKDVPIHALGIQSHLAGHKPPDFARFARFVSDVSDLGLDLMITELDVSDDQLPANVEARDCRVAAVYQSYLDMMLEQPRLISLAAWGLSDRYSWLNEFRPRKDDQPVRPLPFDADLRRKPAWQAMAKALSG